MTLQPETIKKNIAIYEFLKSREVDAWNTCITREPKCRRMGGKRRGESEQEKGREKSPKGSQLGRWQHLRVGGTSSSPKGFFTRWFISSTYFSKLEEAAENHLPGLWPAHNCQSIEATPPRRPQGTSVYLSSCLGMEEAKIPEGAWLQTDLQILGEEKNILSFNSVSLLAWFKAHTSARGKVALLFTVQSELPEPPPHWGPRCHSFPHQERSGARTLSGRTNLGRASVRPASRSRPPLHTLNLRPLPPTSLSLFAHDSSWLLRARMEAQAIVLSFPS